MSPRITASLLGAALALIGAAAHAAPIATCTGVLVEVDMVATADFPMAVVYDDSGIPSRTCVLDLGHAGHSPLRGVCQPGMRCRFTGPYFKRIGNTYYMRYDDPATTAHEAPN